MNQLSKIQRVRMPVDMVEKLSHLKRFGKNKSKFIRQAIDEKIKKDYPILLSEEIKNKNLIKVPF